MTAKPNPFDWMNGIAYEPSPTIIVPPPPARGWGGYFLILCGVAVVVGVAWGLFAT